MLARLRKNLLPFAIVALLSLGGGVVLAQDQPAEPPAEPPAAPETPEAAPPPEEHTPPPAQREGEGGDVESPMRKRANVSPGAMTNQAQEYLEKMKEHLRRIVELQEVARRQKDVIKLNCVNDKLLQVKQLLNIAEAASTNMQEAIARKDEEGRYHEFGRITIAHQQVAVLSTEAENCIGEDLSFLGPTEVTVEEPEQPDDPTVEPTPEYPTVELPPVPTPYI
jgi:hypothetical protein